MSSLRIRKSEKDSLYFLTLTVRNWYYVFDRHQRFEILSESLQFCQQKKGLKIYAFVFMLNHIHLIASAPDLSSVIRDFKSFTSKEISKNICALEPQVLKLFQEKGQFRFWQSGNEPKIIETEKFLSQKVDYIHQNPVRKQYVAEPSHWFWSSVGQARNMIKISSVE